MKINIDNEEKLALAIKTAEGKATVRTVTTVDIQHVCHVVQEGIAKKKFHGTKIHYSGAQKFPNAYKHKPMSTHWTEENRIAVDFYPGYSIRRRVLDFLGLDLDNIFTDMWLDATAMIDPDRRIVTGLYFEVPLDEYNGMPPTELSLSITNYPEGKLFFDRLMETSNGGLEEFIKEYDDTAPKFKHHTLDPIMYKTNVLGEFGTGNAYK